MCIFYLLFIDKLHDSLICLWQSKPGYADIASEYNVGAREYNGLEV